MFTIFEMEWKSLFHHVKEFHLDGSCIQDNLYITQWGQLERESIRLYQTL